MRWRRPTGSARRCWIAGGPGLPLLVLSGNGVGHMLMTLGAMTAGVPVAPASVAYSLQSRDHAHLRAIAELIRPGVVFAEDADRFAAALDAVRPCRRS